MRLGYPCKNLSLADDKPHTFRLASYTDERLVEVVGNNLDSLEAMLRWNAERDLLFFRLSSDMVPFASHPVCTFDWQGHFGQRLARLGDYARERGMRLSMHPGQYVLLNAPREDVVARSIAELAYHAQVFDLMGMDPSAKLQIHVGGTYGDQQAAMQRFAETYAVLPEAVRRRLAVENDERQYCLADCLRLHGLVRKTANLPVIFDSFHHSIFNDEEPLRQAVETAASTWQLADGQLMLDYSSQDPAKQLGAHTASIDEADFRRFVQNTQGLEFDLMLEIKDKENSALIAQAILTEAIG